MIDYKETKKFADLLTKYLESKEDIKNLLEKINKNEILDIAKALNIEIDERALLLISAFIEGGIEKRYQDEEIRYWAIWGALKTYETFNGFKHISPNRAMYIFFTLGRHYIPTLLHEKGVKYEAFKKLSKKEQEKAVKEVLDVYWENVVIRAMAFTEHVNFE